MEKIDRIFKYIENHGLSLSDFERRAGLSNAYFLNTRKRGSDVTLKSLTKIRENLPDEYYRIFPEEKEKNIEHKDVPVIDEKEEAYTPGQSMRVIADLSETTKRLSESILLSEKNIDRILTIVEKVMNLNVGIDLPTPGAEGVIPIRKKDETQPAGK